MPSFDRLRSNKLIVFTAACYVAAALYDTSIVGESASMCWVFVREMIEILPPVIIIATLIDVWVPHQAIIRLLGSSSGVKGIVASIAMGSVFAGPIYAAFPLTQSLMRKGASLTNIVIILSAWAVTKVPMLVVESKFLGIDFMLSRYLLTVPMLVIIGLTVSRLVSERAVRTHLEGISDEDVIRLAERLPGHDCGACGYSSCQEYARAISVHGEDPTLCRFVDGSVTVGA
ncbi:Fe-S cluster protein [archaeon]|nr:MAG: Fe-S cluster protein [archaeon]